MVRDLLSSLPSWVRFVITCRPEAECKELHKCIAAKFRPLEVTSAMMQRPQQIQAAFSARLAHHLQQPCGAAAVHQAMEALQRQGGGDMTYPKVVLGCGLLPLGRGPLQTVTSSGGGDRLKTLPLGVTSAYEALFRSRRQEVGEARWGRVMALLEVLVAAPMPPALNKLEGLSLLPALADLPGWGTLFFEANYQVGAAVAAGSTPNLWVSVNTGCQCGSV